MIVAQTRFSGISRTASAGKSLRWRNGSRPISATAAPSTKLSTLASLTRRPASRLCFRLGAPAGSQKTKRGVAPLLQEVARDAGRQPAAADRQHHDVGRAAARHLVGDLVADRRLALDDVLVVEGRHHVAAARLGEIDRGAVAVVEEIADQPDLDELAAEDAGLVDLLLRRRHRHEHHALPAEMPAHEGKALRVVAGRGADEQRRVGAVGQRMAEEIEGAADLVGADRRQVLALQEDAGAGALRTDARSPASAFPGRSPQRRRRIRHPLHETGHLSSASYRKAAGRATAVARPIAHSKARGHSSRNRAAWGGTVRGEMGELMPVASVALKQVALPEFGEPTVMPTIPLATYEARIEAAAGARRRRRPRRPRRLWRPRACGQRRLSHRLRSALRGNAADPAAGQAAAAAGRQ